MPIVSAAILCFVISVSDGDTLKTRCEGDAFGAEPRIVRLAGIDAPESNQAYGHIAKQKLAALTLGKPVALQCHERTDRYGRSVCKVMVAPATCTESDCRKTLDAGMALITVGLAWWEQRFAREQSPQERGQYEFAQYEAKAKHAGLWRDADPVAPWVWRRDHPTRPRWPGGR